MIAQRVQKEKRPLAPPTPVLLVVPLVARLMLVQLAIVAKVVEANLALERRLLIERRLVLVVDLIGVDLERADRRKRGRTAAADFHVVRAGFAFRVAVLVVDGGGPVVGELPAADLAVPIADVVLLEAFDGFEAPLALPVAVLELLGGESRRLVEGLDVVAERFVRFEGVGAAAALDDPVLGRVFVDFVLAVVVFVEFSVVGEEDGADLAEVASRVVDFHVLDHPVAPETLEEALPDALQRNTARLVEALNVFFKLFLSVEGARTAAAFVFVLGRCRFFDWSCLGTTWDKWFQQTWFDALLKDALQVRNFDPYLQPVYFEIGNNCTV